MDKASLDQFIDYYYDYLIEHYRYPQFRIIGHIYNKFGAEFIHSLPVKYLVNTLGNQYSTVYGTYWAHSTSAPTLYLNGQPRFYILDWLMPFNEWLPLSALSSEERTIFKLKYG
jgi:hypothetical protein